MAQLMPRQQEVDEEEEEYYYDDYYYENSDDEILERLEYHSAMREKKFVILTGDDLRSRIEDDVLRVSCLLSISRDAATILLCEYRCDVKALHQKWIADQETVLKDAGLLLKNESESMKKYDKHLIVESYVENRADMKRCPTPGCGCAVEYCDWGSSVVGLRKNFDVHCKCFYGFCWNCLEEAHSPVDCETVAKWNAKNCSDTETENWILANTRPCPQCQRPIQNVGANDHLNMNCPPPCNSGFCWLCSRASLEHDFPNVECSIYEEAENEGGLSDDAERMRKRAKDLSEYYEKWYSNHISRENDFLDLQMIKNEKLEEMSQIQGLGGVDQLWFITDAWVQIVECKRVFKWASVYGYYLPENELNKKEFFNYLMRQAEATFERFYEYADKELHKFFEGKRSWERFNNFRTELAGHTRVTRNYFDNLVAALEDDLSDVGSDHATTSP